MFNIMLSCLILHKIDSVCASVFHLITSLLPTSRITKKQLLNTTTKEKKRLYSINESKNSFMLICASEIEYKEKYDAKVQHESSTAPFLSLIGTLEDPQSFMVDFENITYKFYSFEKALDVCFKAYYVFNIAYPEACDSMWEFVNQQFYKLPGQNVQTKPGIHTLLAEIKRESFIFLLILNVVLN